MSERDDRPDEQSRDQPSGGLPGLPGRIVAWVLSTKPARVFLLYQEHHGPMLADSVTYRTLFSVFAGVFLGFAIAGIWLSGNADAMDAIVRALDSSVPGLVGSDGLIDPKDLVQPLSLSIAGIFALIGLVGAAIGAINSLRTAMRTLADLPDPQTFILWLILRDLVLAVALGAALVFSAAITFLSGAALDLVFGALSIGRDSWLYAGGTQTIGVIATLVINTAVVALMIRLLSGLKPDARSLWTGAVIGGVGLTVLQVLSSLFIGGARSNPLLASFGSLVALLIWFNFSAQVILIASAYVITGVDEKHDRVKERYGATSIAERAVKKAERRAAAAGADLTRAREQAAKVRGNAAPDSSKDRPAT